MKILILHRFIFVLSFCASFCVCQVKLSVVEYRPFPEQLSVLDLTPSCINWSIANKFILLDENGRELFELGPIGDLNLNGGFGKTISRYGELVWMGVSPTGIQVVDRLENEIITLDYRLDFIQTSPLNKKIFPEKATLDPWGRLFLYSRGHNSIYLYENFHLDKIPFIDFSKIFSNGFCLQDFNVNQNGEIALLGCDGIFHSFSYNGQKLLSFPSTINDAQFLSPVRDDWFIFNRDGDGISIKTETLLSIPGSSIPVIDIASMNRSIAVLSNDHILILDVK